MIKVGYPPGQSDKTIDLTCIEGDPSEERGCAVISSVARSDPLFPKGGILIDLSMHFRGDRAPVHDLAPPA
jgi:hypothetical protein